MKVIVAIDQTEFAEQILREVVLTEWPADTQVKVLTVVEPSSAPMQKNFQSQNSFARRKKLADEMAMKARQKISESCPQCAVHVEVRCGQANEEIVCSAAEWMADRIVIGAHAKLPNRFFVNRVKHCVPNAAGCTVQYVRLNDVTKKTSSSQISPV
jgi:nucleotide-binding universal stress UspA family protein